ncbi:MAG: hypothetical protein R2712_02265 [Vicinamibacterales bacterium]
MTAFDQRAVEAFELNAVDYLPKPVDPPTGPCAVVRARARRPDTPPLADQLDRLVRLMAPANRASQIAVKVQERFILIQAEDIIYALGRGRFD